MSVAPNKPFPRGLWAIGSDFSSAADAANWSKGITGAACATLRRPPTPDREALACWCAMHDAAPMLAVHARLDLALLHPTAGVIAGVRSLPVASLRRLLPAPRSLGVSVHDAAEAAAAELAGADYLIFGPVWETPEKAGILQARGLHALEQLVTATALPVVAIGGLEVPEQVQQVQDAGASAAAVLRAARDAAQFSALVAAW